MLTLGILADKPNALTGMAVVNHNLAYHLCRVYDDELRVIYFAKSGLPDGQKGFAPQSDVYEGYEIVACEGGVWKAKTVEALIKTYNVDILYSEDHWFNAMGMIEASQRTKIPFYFMTPIDALPIQREAIDLLEKYCNKVFVPNQSYKYFKNGTYLPYSVDSQMFKPVIRKVSKEFTFLWIGRHERRKAMERAIAAYEKIHKFYDCNLVVRTDWNNPNTKKIKAYLKRMKIPVVQDLRAECPHKYLANLYSACHAFISSSRAGACELTILEAQACALPVLSTDWTFMYENIVNNENGFLIPIEDEYVFQPKKSVDGKDIAERGRVWGNIDINKLAEKMAWMVENRDAAIKMGYWGFAYIRDGFTWKDVAMSFWQTIEKDLEDRKVYKKGRGV